MHNVKEMGQGGGGCEDFKRVDKETSINFNVWCVD